MKNNIKIILAASIALNACGGGGGADSGNKKSVTVTGNPNQVGTTHTVNSTSAVRTGYFIDAEVIGVGYTTSSGRYGKTNSKGQFFYKAGDEVSFSIGELVLGSAKPDADGVITPWTISLNKANGNHTAAKEKETLLLRVLQALDVDHDPEKGGIIINPKLHEDLKDANSATVVALTESNVLDYHDALRAELDRNNDGLIDVSASTAHAHAVKALGQWNVAHGFAHNAHDNARRYVQNIHNTVQDYTSDLYRAPHAQNVGGIARNYSKGELSSDLKDDQKYALTYMWNEERLAKDIYLALNSLYPATAFENIAKSETKHIQAVERLIEKYDVNVENIIDYANGYLATQLNTAVPGSYGVDSVQKSYDELYAKGEKSKIDALQVGCVVEVTDIDDLENYIAVAQQTNATDLVSTFENLKSASYKHYWSFDKALKAEGVAEGCASLGNKYVKTAGIL